ncbi:MAG: hypothetical protein AAF586_04030 [Planctomycetota bacterium]
MDVKAKIRPGYQARLGIIALALLAFAAWFYYDGAIAYPKKQEIQLAYQALAEEGRAGEWREVAEANGWPTETPEAPLSDTSIRTQFLMGTLCLPIGLYFAVVFAMASRRWVGAAADGLHDHRRRLAAWESIDSIDDSRWKTKGIVWVHFTDASGKADKMLLDDWKYDRDATRAIVDRLQEERPEASTDGELARQEPADAEPDAPTEAVRSDV